METIDPQDRYVHLDAEGRASVLPGGEAFWSLPESELERFGNGWLVTEYTFTADWSNWEMHPAGDELVYLLSGDLAFLIDLPEGLQSTRLTGRGALLVPRGTWHTAKVLAPSRVLFVTSGAGTQHRPA
jgi:mannose-6-phosphate isomerase-like protein (cupin superfamily)